MLSIIYIKSKTWSQKIKFDLNFDKATFGKQIEYFERFTIEEVNRGVIIKYLRDVLKIRNRLIHHLFEIEKFNEELKEYFEKSNKLFILLIQYYNDISEHILYELEDFNFDRLL